MESERRPNPPGWVPPKAPYNPYDATDIRPPEGYPSEFKAPGKPRNWSVVPKEPSNYRVVKDTLKRMQYTPRPFSELYPGQYKILRRTDRSKFRSGVKYASVLLSSSVIILGVFFYRWNDGYDNVFSTPYRFQLRMRDKIFGNLTEQQKEDLRGKQRGLVSTGSETPVLMPSGGDDSIAMQRPQRSHIIEAERIRQEREEAILRAVDIAKAALKEEPAKAPAAGSQRKKFLGIF
ncbi:Gastric triacylglycerol lipase [Sugiyamaella lignohabitans]|uniref:Gastric triacylglycerol lipase n=1 Tax=Sugiyamaella lignohabitans TaxID=796027 RepID=A0A167DQN1_9ASCO|nr:Gastric triacylglycerol lipase [Sugiyamaella lignohabitans]ANB13176.1 Gastric triacylglycerol lipase [Sugiyamaella lignohabitans]